MGFVLEGPDGAGKTTLAHQLCNTYELGLRHFGPPVKPPLEEYLHWLIDSPTHNLVIDRFHLGESVYGPMWRGTEPLPRPILAAIEWALMIRGYTLVHVTQPLKLLCDAIEERGDELVKVVEMTKIVEGYWRVMGMSFMPRFTYDWHHPSIPTWPVKLRRLSWMYAQQMGGYPGTGSLEPEVIFVGERTNPNLIVESRGVPFALGSSAEWLVAAIWSLGWQKVSYITNAKKADGDEDMVAREIRWFRARAHEEDRPLPRVIGLGGTAAKLLTRHQIPFWPVYHPSYHKRFNFKEGPESYAQSFLPS